MDAATAISGCGPAFMALVVEALTDAGVEQGLTARAGRAARGQHDGGSAELLAARRDDAPSRQAPGDLARAASRPPGLAALERHGVRAAFADAVDAVVRAKARSGPSAPSGEEECG